MPLRGDPSPTERSWFSKPISDLIVERGSMVVGFDPERDLHLIQGNITPGFRKDFQDLLFVHFPNGTAGRAWVGDLYSDVTSAWEVATFNRLYSKIRHPPPFGQEAGWTPPERSARDVH